MPEEKIRVALLIRDLGYAGAQRQLAALARGLEPGRFDVRVFCFYGGPLLDELTAAGIPVTCLEKRHRWDLSGFAFRVARELRAARPDVLYSFLSESNLLAALLKPLLPRTRIVWGLRDSETDAALYGWLGRLVFALGRPFSRWPDCIIANSRSGARYYAAQGYPEENLRVVPNGIDLDRFKPDSSERERVRRELGVGEHETLFGVVGRLSPMKDHATFLQAAARLEGPVRFLCVGGGPDDYASTLREMAGSLGLAGRVLWSPPRQDMPAVFNALDALVSSSAFGEGFSNVVGEAMACGTPCIVTQVGDSSWLVGKSGFSVPPREPEALAQAMRQFLALGPEERTGLKNQARARMEQNFAVPEMVRKTTVLLVPGPPPQPAKVLFVITALGTGGAEMMLAQLVTHLDRSRFAPEVVSLADGGKHADLLSQAGIPVHGLGMQPGRPSLRSLLRLRSLIQKMRPDLVVGWMYHGNLAATLASWSGWPVPVLWNVRQSLYSLKLEKRGSALVIRLLAWLGFNPAHVLYNSRISARQHEAIGYPAGKTVIVPNGFDTTTFQPFSQARASVRQELGLPPSTLLVGRFGRNSAMKDYPCFIAAMRNLPQAHAIIAGTGTSELKDLPPNIHVLGERHDLPRLTAALDVACSSSAFGEGFPNVVAEAMSCAVPCVVTDVGDSAWLLEGAGKVVPPHDPAALTQALSGLLSLPRQEREAIGRRGRQRIQDHFSLPAVVRQFQDLLALSKR